ncbi:MAG: SLBB domain-containing protein, partial [Bacteroidales bacterium]|nr:SLBB domain-containing protein [Bacteroidales bacterium]
MNNRTYLGRKFPALLKLLFFLFLLVSVSQLHAQDLNNLNSTDLTSIKVDGLTNEQVQAFIDRASSTGMTMEQLEAAALAKGMPYGEIVKLRTRIGNLKSSPGSSSRSSSSEIPDEITLSQKEDVFETSGTQKAEIFGRHLFNQKNLTFTPSRNIPTPKNYILGPGDEILIEIYGASQETYRLLISPEGRVKISNLAPILLNGLSIEDATVLLERRLSGIYSGMKGASPNTFAQISLGNLRSISVNIVGEVELPGTYTLSSFSTAFNALYLAGGPNNKGSFRKINIIRDNKVFRTVDLYDFLLGGISENNVRLQDQDIVFVSEYQARVSIEGEVKRPAVYEMAENETLNDLISFSGGFAENAFGDKLTIMRNTPTQKKILDINQSDFEHTVLLNGDGVFVGKLLDRYENKVSINGAVYREGDYELTEGMCLMDLIEKAEGLREDTYLPMASLYRLQDNLKIKIIPVDLEALINGNMEDIPLQREDVLNISSVFDLEEEYTVQINGELQSPGRFQYYDNMTVAELIRLAGGLKESASLARLEIARRIKDNEAEES